jgi:hypothetical protein
MEGSADENQIVKIARGNAGMGMKRIIVHIDSLMLNGLCHEDRHAVAAALQRELARLPSNPGTAARLVAMGEAPRLRVGAIPIDSGSKPQRLGVEVARGLGKEMKI